MSDTIWNAEQAIFNLKNQIADKDARIHELNEALGEADKRIHLLRRVLRQAQQAWRYSLDYDAEMDREIPGAWDALDQAMRHALAGEWTDEDEDTITRAVKYPQPVDIRTSAPVDR